MVFTSRTFCRKADWPRDVRDIYRVVHPGVRFFFLFFPESEARENLMISCARDALKNNAASLLALRHRAYMLNSTGIRHNRTFSLPSIFA